MSEQKKEKKVKVINVPKKKRPLATPSLILRICLIICFVLCMLLLSSPFLSAKLYITEDLEITPTVTKAYTKLATQEEIDSAAAQLEEAFQALAKAETEEESQTSEEVKDGLAYRALPTADYQWSYTLKQGIDGKTLAELVDKSRSLDKSEYTPESVSVLNKATLNGQKYLCASVIVRQSVLQMAMGGAIGESFGNVEGLGGAISHSVFAMLLAVVPFVCFVTLCFDRRGHIKHITCMAGAILCLVDIFLLLYPYVGSGAILSIILYLVICGLNLASIYAKQQEDYIIAHPQEEPEFTQKHPQFVKALINAKAFRQQEPVKTPAPKGKHSKKKK